MQKFSVRHPFMAGYAATLATGLIFWGIRGVVGANLLNLLGMLALVGLAFYWNKLNSYAKLACEKYDLHFNLGPKATAQSALAAVLQHGDCSPWPR
jgi:hypothetical protein